MTSYKISNEISKKLKEEEEKEKNKEKENNVSNNENADNSVTSENKSESNQTIKNVADTSIEKVETDKKDKELKDKNIGEVIDDLTEIKNQYKTLDFVDAPDSLNLEKIDIKDISDEELNKLAKDSLAEKYNLKTQSTNQSFADKIDDIIKNNQSLQEQHKSSVDKVNNYYDNSIKETENQALKRGLARSSIIISEISKIEGSRAGELSNILENLQNSLYENEVQIDKLNRQKDEALSNLDIEYAIELDQKINALAEDYAKQKEDAIKFNNNVEKLEAEYKLTLDKQKQDKKKQNLTLEEKYGTDIYNEEIQANQYAYLKSYFDSLAPKYALNIFLTSKELKNILGDNYAKMYKYLSSRI